MASLPYVPIIDIEEVEDVDENYNPIISKVYVLRMMNIDYPMQVDPKLFTINDENGSPLRVEIMTTISQKDDGDSVMDDDDIYARELQRIKEEPAKRLMAKNERLKKQFKELQEKKRKEDREVEKLRETVETMENDLRNTKEDFEAHKSREPSPIKQKYDNNYKKYIERVEELEKIKDNIAKDTLEALSGIVGSIPGANDLLRSGKRKDDDDDDEIINNVGRGHKNRKKYKPAADAKWYINNDHEFLKALGIPEKLSVNINLNTREAGLEYKEEIFINSLNIIWFKFFAIEFYDVLFGVRETSIPSIVNIEYDFQNFTHQVTNPLFIGSKTQKVRNNTFKNPIFWFLKL